MDKYITAQSQKFRIQRPATKKIFLLGSVVVSFSILFFSLPVLAHDGSLFLSPPSQSFPIGDEFSVNLLLDTGDHAINAAQATIRFPSDKLTVKKISKENSVFSLWPKEPHYSNELGEISTIGGLPSPGFSGQGNFVTIHFVARDTGEAFIFLNDVKLLANDGKGTDILRFITNSKYYIYNPQVGTPRAVGSALLFSSTHPDERQWYSNNNPNFEWQLDDDVEGVSFLLDQNPQSLPDEISEGRVVSANYKKLPDGIWYFHLRFKYANDWSQTMHYRVQIDTEPPTPFEIIIDNKGDPTNPKPNLYFETRDKMSGIDKYKIKIGNDDFVELLTAEISKLFTPGSHQIVVRASDKAANSVKAETILNIDPIAGPKINILPAKYISGQETLYLAGTALPHTQITLFLRENAKLVKQWQTISNIMGEWEFSTKDLIKTGSYALSAMAKDDRGAVSLETPPQNIEVTFAGLNLFGFLIALKNLIIFLIVLLFFGVLTSIYLTLKNRSEKSRLLKETIEAKSSLLNNFLRLEFDLKAKIEMMDAVPGFNKQELEVYKCLMESLTNSRRLIEKEINDIEKALS